MKVIEGFEIQEDNLRMDQLSDALMTELFFHHPSRGPIRVYADGFLVYDNIDSVILYRTTGQATNGTLYSLPDVVRGHY